MTELARSARFWDSAAERYSRAPIKDMAGYDRTVARTRELLLRTDRVLELGCGTGMTALLLASGVARFDGCDISEEMVAIAREKADAQGVTRAHFTVAPAEQPPGSDGGYDAVLALNLLHLVSDRTTVLRQARRVLKPGGLFITKTPCLSEMSVFIRMAVPVMRLIGLAPQVDTFDAATLEQEIVAAGFTMVERARHGSAGNDARIFLVARKA
jgi:ubiquinone/menaquinone biosynthesis C-methylase UbiE